MKLNVLHMLDSFNEGGTERQAVQLIRLLHESGDHRLHVACLSGDGVLRGEVERFGLGEIASYPLTGFYNRNAVAQLKRLARHLKERKIDVIHTHDYYTNIFGMTAAALARVPVRVASRRQSAVRAAAKRLVERRAYGLAHAVVANCEEVRSQLLKEGVHAEKIVTVHNGLEMERIAPRPGLRRDEALAEFNLPREEGRRFVAIVANLRSVKDHHTFLRAARRVRETVPEAGFIIAGEGELLSSLRALAARFGLERDTFFIGRCTKLAELLFVSDVCVLSSTSEGFSNSILEYMAAGRAVVATDVGGAREAVVEGETGYLVKAGDDERMAHSIISLLKNPEQARAMGERGRRIVKEKFSCEAQLERTENLYQRLVALVQPQRPQVTEEHQPRKRHGGRPGEPIKLSRTMPKPEERSISTRAGGATENAAPPAPVRVLIVAPSTGILGGQAVQAARLLARLKEEPSLSVSFLPINPQLPGVLRRLQMIKYLRTVVTSLVYCASLLARVGTYDCVHIFSASYFSFLLAPTPAILISKLYGRKSVLNYRSGEAEDHFKRWRRTAIRTVRLVDAVVVPSGYLVDVFKRFGVNARPIFNFVETDRFRFRERRPLSPVFLSNRNLEPLYNVGCVLRAFALIQRRFPDARLTLAGDGHQRGELERLASELGLRNTLFIGRVAPEKMPELYDAADIYLNSPNVDNMPGSIIEAFASGLPVVTTDAGGIPYIVTDGETGMLVQCDDHERMAERAIRLLEDQALASRITAQAREECRKYSWDSVRTEWLGLYYSLAGRGQALPVSEQVVGASARVPVSEH